MENKTYQEACKDLQEQIDIMIKAYNNYIKNVFLIQFFEKINKND